MAALTAQPPKTGWAYPGEGRTGHYFTGLIHVISACGRWTVTNLESKILAGQPPVVCGTCATAALRATAPTETRIT